MPLIVNKEDIKKEIILAFRECLKEKPILKVTMRDIAKQAGISHSKIIYYFKNKQELVLTYIDYVNELYTDFFVNWFSQKESENFKCANKREYIDALLKDIVNIENNEHSKAFIQIYTLAQFDPDIKAVIELAYSKWIKAIQQLLASIYEKNMDEHAQAVLILIEGVLLYSSNSNPNDCTKIQIIDKIQDL